MLPRCTATGLRALSIVLGIALTSPAEGAEGTATATASASTPRPPAPTMAPLTFSIDGTTVHLTGPDGRARTVTSPCKGLGVAADKSLLYVACGEAGLAVFSLAGPDAPTFLHLRALGGTVVGLHTAADGAVWAEIARLEGLRLGPMTLAQAQSDAVSTDQIVSAVGASVGAVPVSAPTGPIDASMAVATVAGGVAAHDLRCAPPAPSVQLSASTVGHVIALQPTAAIVDLGRANGIGKDDHVAIYRELLVPVGEGLEAVSEELLAVGPVTAVTDDRAQIELGRNETVPVASLARKTNSEITASRYLPPRAAGLWEIGATLRPFLAIGSLGVGMVSEASVGLRLENGLHVATVFEPLAGAMAEGGNIVTMAGNVVASYDTRLFEVGLGAGWAAVNHSLDGSARAADSGGFDVRIDRVRSGLSIAQVARLGAQDGVQLLVRNTFLLYKSAFHYGGTIASLMTPVGERSWLFGRGGAGSTGFSFGELGLRLLVAGNGHRDSLFVSASIGGANVSGEKNSTCYVYNEMGQPQQPYSCYQSVSYGGPLVGVGVELRL